MSRYSLLALAFIACFSVSLNAAIIDFEDLYSGMNLNSTSDIPTGYQGFSWSDSFRVIPVDYASTINTPGYTNGIAGNVAGYTSGGTGSNQVVLSSDQTFDFLGATFTSAWRMNQDVWVMGYMGGQLLYNEIVYASYDTPAQLSFAIQGIDTLVITPGYGGTSIRPDAYGNHIVIDDMNIVVPEPLTVSLLAIGGAVLLRRNKYKSC